MQLINIDHDFYTVKFDLKADKEFVLTGGPWIIAGQYLTIHKWRPGFVPATEVITRMAIWVRILGVPIEYFNVWAMRMIGSLLGKLLKIDVNTNSQYRGKFARICVEIDVTKPLEAFIQINNGWYNLEYEGMPEICFRCGRYGHKRESCPWSIDPMVEKVDGGENESNIMNMDEPIVKSAQSSDDVSAIYGTWMQVKPRGRPRKINNGQGGVDVSFNG